MLGRKKKKEIKLDSQSFINYPELSVQSKMLIWEYLNPKNDIKEILKIPLSIESSLKYWEDKKCDDLPTARNMITRIKKRSDKRMNFIYDTYHKREKLINELVYSTVIFLSMNNKNRAVGSQYYSTLNIILKYIETNTNNIFSISDMNENFQEVLLLEIRNEKSIYFSRKGLKTLSRQILETSFKEKNITSYLGQRELLSEKRTGQKARDDISQEITVQILAYAYKEMNLIIEKCDNLKKWRKSYHKKRFDSIKNFAFTYLNYPTYFNNYSSLQLKNISISGYRKRYSNLCKIVHNIDLSKLDLKELKKLSRGGVNISRLDNPEIMAWFIDDILNNFPFCTEGFMTTNTPLSKYSKWNIKSGIYNHLKPYGVTRQELIDVFYDVLAMNYPSKDEMIPFCLFWMLQTGCNQEGLLNMCSKEKINEKIYDVGEYKLDENVQIIKSYKSRSTNDNYYFPLDSRERGGLYDVIVFLKDYIHPIWDYQSENGNPSILAPFWMYRSHKNQSAEKKVNILNRNSLKQGFKSFLKRNKVLDKNGDRVNYVHLSKFRNTFITMADLNGASIEEIQNWIRHDSFDTRFIYHGNSNDQKNRNYRLIYAIQESIINDAREFRGKLLVDSSKNEDMIETLVSSCSNNKEPSFKGAKKLTKDELCIDFDLCLSCNNSRVFKEHLPQICLRIIQFETLRKNMSSDEWENNYGQKYVVAKSTLKVWIKNGGRKNDINDAFNIARSGEVQLPLLFPYGSIKIEEEQFNVN